jgi:hypothetical protein
MRQRTVTQAYSRNVFLLYLCFEIYDSPNPATFFRSADSLTCHGQTTPPPTPHLRRKYPPSDTVTIVADSQLGEGATGTVHGGILTVDTGTECVAVQVAIKLAFGEDQKDRLQHEAGVYGQLVNAGVGGIPAPFGLFTDPEDDTLALVLTHGGKSVHALKKEEIDIQKRYGQTVVYCRKTHA